MTALGVVAFIVGILISILLHEAGHLVTAKRYGMKATEFFAGFGPRIWSFRRGETEYGLKAIPAGGYVKILGMAEEEEVAEEDQPRAFYRQPGWQRAIVLASGSFTHFVIAFVLLFVMAVGIGLPQSSGPTLTVGKVLPCVPDSPQAQCTQSDPASPAAQAGLQQGDRIVAFAGEPVNSWDEFAKAIQGQGTGKVSLTVVRDGERIKLHPDLARGSSGGGFLGMVPSARVSTTNLGPIDGLVYAGEAFGQIMVGTAKVFAAIPSMIPNLFSADRGEGGPSDAGGVSSVVGIARISGEIFAQGDSWSRTLLTFFGIMVSVNISVGVLNLLPIMPLDGGRLAVLGYERAKAGIFRLRGRADPGPVDMSKLMPVTSLALILIIGFAVLLILADIFNPLNPL